MKTLKWGELGWRWAAAPLAAVGMHCQGPPPWFHSRGRTPLAATVVHYRGPSTRVNVVVYSRESQPDAVEVASSRCCHRLCRSCHRINMAQLSFCVFHFHHWLGLSSHCRHDLTKVRPDLGRTMSLMAYRWWRSDFYVDFHAKMLLFVYI